MLELSAIFGTYFPQILTGVACASSIYWGVKSDIKNISAELKTHKEAQEKINQSVTDSLASITDKLFKIASEK